MKTNQQRWWQRFATLHFFENVAARLGPVCYVIAGILIAIGTVWGLFFAPADVQQSDAFRIIYVHVPMASLSLGIYVSLAAAGAIYFIWDKPLAAYYMRGVAPLGAVITALALFTGSVWGKPMWGTYWTWGDPRLLSELILLFLYLGYLGLIHAIERETLANRIGSVLLLIGVVNIPIIHYSVVWWNSLHQGSTIFKMGAPSIALSMLWPLLINLLGFALFVLGYALIATRTQLIKARTQAAWLARLGGE